MKEIVKLVKGRRHCQRSIFPNAERAAARTRGDIHSEDFSKPAKIACASLGVTSLLAAAQRTMPKEPCVSIPRASAISRARHHRSGTNRV